ncbi:VWA domain-containing protein [Chloroflexota bacterium]
MIFENPNALWSLLALPPLLYGLGFWGWMAKKEATIIFPSVLRHLRRRQIEKYIIAGVLMALLIVVLALPKVAYTAPAPAEKTGEIALLIDVSRSMSARKELDSPSRLERIKPYLYEIIDSMEELGQVKISLHGFTNIARSHVPFIGKEDYPYLKESIKKVLDINSTPGKDTGFGVSLLNVAGKFSMGNETKLIIIFSDGEPFFGSTRGVTEFERVFLDRAVEKAVEEGIKVITVGVGEREGATIPLYDSYGEFTGAYALERLGVVFTSYLEEDVLNEIASRTGGEYFFEENTKGLAKFINENLSSVNAEEVTEEVKIYRSIAHWFLLVALPIWVVFARRHLLG